MIFGDSHSDSQQKGSLGSEPSVESQFPNERVDHNLFLISTNVYGPPPTLKPEVLLHLMKEGQAQLDIKSIPPLSGTSEKLSDDPISLSQGEIGASIKRIHANNIQDNESANQRQRQSKRSKLQEAELERRRSSPLITNPDHQFPADMEERDRRNMQHRIICLLLGNLYPAGNIVEEILEEREGYRPMILDIGTGSGIWAVEMATKFPYCEVIGLDLVPPRLGSKEIPPNCRFEVDDANLSLSHWANTFDFVHCRAVEAGIQDWEAFTYNVAQILRPGGLFLSGSGGPQLLNEKREPCRVITEGEPGFRWAQKLLSVIHEAILDQGSVWTAPHWHEIAERNPNYEAVISQQMLMPIGNWLPAGSCPDHQYAAELMCQNFIYLFRAFKALLISRGYPEATIDFWIDETVKELSELKVHTTATWSWTWCRRTGIPWVPPAFDSPNQV